MNDEPCVTVLVLWFSLMFCTQHLRRSAYAIGISANASQSEWGLAASEARGGVSAGRACEGGAGGSPQPWLQHGPPEAEERSHC